MDVSAMGVIDVGGSRNAGENPHVQADDHYTATCTMDHGDRTRVAAA